MHKPKRMSDVAKVAGVSTMTVSRVLKAHTSVSDEVRQRVLAVIDHLDYQPNEVARSLRDRRSRQIGVLVPNLFDPFFAACAHTISTVAKQHAYSVVLSTSNESPHDELDETSRMMRRAIEGLLVIPATAPASLPSLLMQRAFHHLPIVALDRPIEGDRYDCVLVENSEGSRLGTNHLIQLGHNNIAYLGLSSVLYTMQMRERGFCSAMQDARLQPTILHLAETIDSARQAVNGLLRSKTPPTALFCANNLITRHVLHCLQEHGIYPPDRTALVGFDDFETADLLRPGITTVRQPVEAMGRIAADLLFAQLGRSDLVASHQSRRIMLPVELIVRGSCGSPLAR